MPLLLLLLGLKANAECAKDNHYGDTRKHDKGAFLKPLWITHPGWMAPGARNKFGAPMFGPEVRREQILY